MANNRVVAEARDLRTIEVCVEKREDGAGVTLSGYAAVFDQETNILDLFREVVRPGAFARALREDQDVIAHYWHGRGAPLPLGRTTSSPATLRLKEDKKGLRYEVDLPDTQSAQELARAIERGDIQGSSFAFRTVDGGERWTEVKGELPLRELLDVDLFDVSPVPRPAYQGTNVSVREAADVFDEHVQAVRGQESEEAGGKEHDAAQERARALALQDQVVTEALINH